MTDPRPAAFAPRTPVTATYPPSDAVPALRAVAAPSVVDALLSTPPPATQHHVRIQLVEGDRFGVVIGSQRHWLAVATGCLLRPCVGDTVLVSLAGESGYILCVLERATSQDATVSVPGNLHLHLPNGGLTISATQGVAIDAGTAFAVRGQAASMQFAQAGLLVDALSVVGDTVQATWRDRSVISQNSLEVAARMETRAGDSVRRVNGHEDTVAGSMRTRVSHDWTVRADRAELTAEQRLKLDAGQVQLG